MNKSASESLDQHPYKMNGYLHICNHYPIWVCSLAVNMDNTDEASLYCLETITFSPHKMLKM